MKSKYVNMQWTTFIIERDYDEMKNDKMIDLWI